MNKRQRKKQNDTYMVFMVISRKGRLTKKKVKGQKMCLPLLSVYGPNKNRRHYDEQLLKQSIMKCSKYLTTK